MCPRVHLCMSVYAWEHVCMCVLVHECVRMGVCVCVYLHEDGMSECVRV